MESLSRSTSLLNTSASSSSTSGGVPDGGTGILAVILLKDSPSGRKVGSMERMIPLIVRSLRISCREMRRGHQDRHHRGDGHRDQKAV